MTLAARIVLLGLALVSAKQRPNIVMLVTDDQDLVFDSMQALPHLSRKASYKIKHVWRVVEYRACGMQAHAAQMAVG